MEKIGFPAFYKKPKIILSLILAVFFLKGVFLATLSPIFDGQDEARHYNTIQYLANLKGQDQATKDSAVSKGQKRSKADKANLETYAFSEEIQQTATATNTDILRGDIFNTIVFSNNFDGTNEAQINQQPWQPINYSAQPDIVYGTGLYHFLASSIEKTFSDQSILVRFYLIRIFSVLLGTLAVFFFYLTAKTVGFSSKHSLLLTAILSFQPKFSIYFMNINYDVLLIPMFFLFTMAAVLALKKGLDWKNLTLLIASVYLGILTKNTATILLPALALLLAYFLYEGIKLKSKNFKYGVYILCLIVFVFLAFYLKNYLPAGHHSFGQTATSIGNYLSKTLTIGRFGLSSRTYWGTLSWVNNWLLNNATNFIWAIQAFAVAGLGLLFFSKKPYPEYLPAKKYIVFFIGMVIALQLGIRTVDWAFFNKYGSLETGTPGRYFLPNLGTHIILVFTGLGMLFSYFKKEKYFDYSLIIGLILMFAFMMYLIFDVIILRFYL